MTVDALAAGKDVYVEKPLTHSLSENKIITAAIARHPRIVQVGTQQRSMPHIIRARELVQGGKLGTVHKVHLTWNRNTDRVRRGPQNVDQNKLDWPAFLGNAPKQAFDDYRFRNWRWFWDFGNGILTDLMVHWIDVAHWILNLDHPEAPSPSAATTPAAASGKRPTRSRRCSFIPTICKSISKERSATPATAP